MRLAITRRIIVTLSVLISGIGLAITPANPAQAEQCGSAHDSINFVDPGRPFMRMGAANMTVHWCWDGQKITHYDAPVVWTSVTLDGALNSFQVDPAVQWPEHPQNGGYWTVETIVTGNFHPCVPSKAFCLPGTNFRLDMDVFGDGVNYIANRRNIP
jgi:hypothetical protein